MRRRNLLPLLLIFTVSCDGPAGGGPVQSKRTDPVELELRGPYQAVLRPLRPALTPKFNGSLMIVRDRDELVAGLRYSGGVPETLAIQNVHRGTRCPELPRDDANGDGVIDADEGAAVYGPVLIPLDDDLSAQHLGGGIFPVSDRYGHYYWSRTVEYARLERDLRDADLNPQDDLAKVDGSTAISVKGLAVVVAGVPAATPLPNSVAGRGRYSAHMALPIACGILARPGRVPGRIDRDETDIPVPETGGVGGSSGVDDGADFPEEPTTGGETSGETGDYGTEEAEPTDPASNGETTGGLPGAA
jgi:hypothetical protein